MLLSLDDDARQHRHILARVYTVDRKCFVLKIFREQKIVVFNFHGWNQPQKLNTDRTLYVTLCTSTVGTAAMDTLRSLERERRYNTSDLTRNCPTKSLSASALERQSNIGSDSD